MAYVSALEAALRAVQRSVPRESQETLWQIIRDTMRANGRGPRFHAPEHLARALEEDGLVRLDALLSRDDAARICAYFRERPVFGSHIATRSDGVPRSMAETASGGPAGAYHLEDVVRAPLLLDLANSPRVLALAESHLGCAPTLYSMNAIWTFAGGELQTQTFHRDHDDFRFVSLFIILTDTAQGDGSHLYVRKTHRMETDAVPPDQIAEVYGPAGTAWMADTFGLHRGERVKSDRLLFWARYGLYLNAAYDDDRTRPVRLDSIPDDPYFAHVNRGIVSAR